MLGEGEQAAAGDRATCGLVADDDQQTERREGALDRHRLAPVDPFQPLVDPFL